MSRLPTFLRARGRLALAGELPRTPSGGDRGAGVTVARSTAETIEFCRQQVGQGWKTLLLAGSGRTDASATRLWDVLADVEGWPRWSPLHSAARWAEGDSLSVGARFEQRLELGFPVGRSTEHVTLAFADPGRRAGWVGDNNGVHSCHLWTFAPAVGGGTAVSNVEALSGLGIALVRPLVAARWRRQFQAAVDGLIATAESGR